MDDIRGRIIGEKIGKEAFELSSSFFTTILNDSNQTNLINDVNIFPNPVEKNIFINLNTEGLYYVDIFNILGIKIHSEQIGKMENIVNLSKLTPGVYFIKINSLENNIYFIKKIIKVD